MNSPIEVGNDQRITDWKRVRRYLMVNAERLSKLGGMLQEELSSVQQVTPTLPTPLPRTMLPPIVDLVAAAPATRSRPVPGLVFPVGALEESARNSTAVGEAQDPAIA
jgi:hypothetical protein